MSSSFCSAAKRTATDYGYSHGWQAHPEAIFARDETRHENQVPLSPAFPDQLFQLSKKNVALRIEFVKAILRQGNTFLIPQIAHPKHHLVQLPMQSLKIAESGLRPVA